MKKTYLITLAAPLLAIMGPGCGEDSCFSGRTWVSVRGGRRRLSDIRVGDAVLSFDMQTARLVEREVLRVFRHGVKEVGTVGRLGLTGITANHPVLEERTGEFMRADSLEGAHGLYFDGTRLRRRKLGGFKTRGYQPEAVFNLMVAETHTYVADGLVVHNKSDGGDEYGFGGQILGTTGGTNGGLQPPGLGGQPSGGQSAGGENAGGEGGAPQGGAGGAGGGG